METITKFFKEENDFLYRRGEERGAVKGREEGRQEEKLETVTSLILEIGLPDEQIAVAARVPLSFVEQVRAGLKK